MEPPARRRLGRYAPALVVALPLLAVAVLFSASNAGGQLPTGSMITSENVKFVKNIAEASDGVGARVVGNRLFVTTTKDLLVYDITDPVNPKNIGGINANISFENEEVPTNGKLLGVSGQIGGCSPVGGPVVPPNVTNCLVIYDVSKSEDPRVVKVVPGAGDHTQTCIYDCQYFIGDSGTIVDARDPANATVLRYTENQGTDPDKQKGDKIRWTDALGELDRGCHYQVEVRPGVVAAACQPMHVVSMNAEDGGSITQPKVLARYRHELGPREDPPYYSSGEPTENPDPGVRRFIHGFRWPNAGGDKFAFAGGETNFNARCSDRVGAFMVFDTRTPSPQGDFTQTDQVFPQQGNYVDGSGRGQTQILGCSAHWFEEHPTFKNGGMVALAEYEQGTRFLQVTPEGRIRQLGYALPIGGSTSAPHWAPDGRTVYNIDYTRGLDVLRYEGPLVVPDEQGNVERPPQATAPGEQELSEQGASQTFAPTKPPAGGTAASADAGCGPGTGFRSVAVRGGAVRVKRRLQKPFSFSLFQQAQGRKVLSNRLAKRVRRTTASSLALPRRARPGLYLARVTMDLAGVDDVRRIVLQRRGGRWTVRPRAYLRTTCGALSAFKLDRSAFGGRTRRALRVSYRLPRAVDGVTLEVLRGKKVVRRLKKAGTAARAYRFTVPARIARAGTDVRVRITVRRAGARVVETLVARRL